MTAPILSSVPLCRVRFVRTRNNVALATQGLKATPTITRLNVPSQHGFIDLEVVSSQVDPDTGVGYMDLVVNDDPQVAENFGWTITGDGWAGFARTVSVPQSGSGVDTIVAQGVEMPAVWLNELADFTGASGPVGSEVATRSWVDEALDLHEAASDPHPQYAMDGESGGGGSAPNATTTIKGIARLLGGTADAPTIPATALTGTIDDARIPAGIARDSEVATAVANLVNSAPSTLDTLGEIAAAIAADESTAAALTTAVGGKAPAFTQSTTKTAAYTAAANEIVPADTSGGTFTITGPTSGAPFGVRWKVGTAAPTVAAPAGYTINGAASITMGLAPGTSAGEVATWQAFGTDYQSIGGLKPQTALDTRHGSILNTHLLAWAYAQAFRLVSATRDANEAIMTGSVAWPDGSTGTFTTDTASSTFPGAIDAYHITYVPTSGATKTITQSAVTRDAGGAVVAQPALAVA